MAVPKKRTSKTKTRVRKTIWKKKAEKQVSKLFSKINKFEKKKPYRLLRWKKILEVLLLAMKKKQLNNNILKDLVKKQYSEKTNS